MINYLSKLSVNTLQNQRREKHKRYLYKQEDLSLQLLGGQTRRDS